MTESRRPPQEPDCRDIPSGCGQNYAATKGAVHVWTYSMARP
ncbi:hypothetical protein STSO111631_09840 [Stackebrandtia soli]